MINSIISVNNIGKGSINHNSGLIILQRQGCSTTLNASCDLFSVAFSDWFDNRGTHWEVFYGSKNAWGFVLNGQRFKTGTERSSSSAIVAATKAINELLKLAGHTIEHTISPIVQDYMFNFGISYKYCDDDKIISPLRYRSSDGVILNSLGNVVVTFASDNIFGAVIDSKIDIEIKAVEEALHKGFNQCDLKKGFDVCKRRLAWLAGEYIKGVSIAKSGTCRCHVLGRDMELED